MAHCFYKGLWIQFLLGISYFLFLDNWLIHEKHSALREGYYKKYFYQYFFNFKNNSYFLIFFPVEAILDIHNGTGDYIIPDKYSLQKSMIVDQLNIIVEKKLYEPKGKNK